MSAARPALRASLREAGFSRSDTAVRVASPSGPSRPPETSPSALAIAAARYIGAGDAALGRDLPLGQGRAGIQAIPEGDDHGLPLVQASLDAPAHLGAGVTGIQLLQHIVVHADGVHQRQGVAVPIPVNGIRQGDLPLQLPLGAEVHQDLVFDTAGGIGGQAHVLVRLEGADPLDQSDGADGDQIVLIPVGRIVLFHDVRHQAQVVLDEDVPGLQITLRHPLQVHPLLLRFQRTGEGAASPAGEAQGEEQAVEHQQNPRSEHLSHLHSSTLFRPRLSLCQRSCSMRASPAERERN